MLHVQQRKNKYQFYSLWFNRPGLEPTIYLTRHKHAIHYTTDAGVITLNLYMFLTIYIYHQFDVDIYHVVYVEIPVIICTDETTVNSRNCENMGEKCGWELERC